jgi:hypothetical protein
MSTSFSYRRKRILIAVTLPQYLWVAIQTSH